MKIVFPKLFRSKLFLGAMLILLIGVFAVELRQWQAREAVDKEIEHLVSEQQALDQKNRDLEQSLLYFGSDAYKEKLAREQLGLKREGEIVINFPKLAENTNAAAPEAGEQSNPEKWWQYIFLNHN